jgi:flagellar protein FliJ
MAKYSFRLESVKKVRQWARDQRRAALADAFRAAEILSEKQNELMQEETALRALKRSATAERYLDVSRLVDVQRYELLLKARRDELTKQDKLLSVEIERRRQQLVEADRDVRVMELLDERHRREHGRKQARIETKLLDESAMLQWRNR